MGKNAIIYWHMNYYFNLALEGIQNLRSLNHHYYLQQKVHTIVSQSELSISLDHTYVLICWLGILGAAVLTARKCKKNVKKCKKKM